MLFSRGARSARMPSSSCGGAPCVEVVVREVWRRALAGQPAPPPPVVVGLAVVAAVLVLAPVAWPRTRHVVTLAHEGALLHSSTRASGHNEHLSRTAWVAARRHPTKQWLSGTTSHAASRVASGADHSKPEAACPHAGRRPRLAAPGRMLSLIHISEPTRLGM